MAFNANLPANTEYIADAPAEIRENFRALKEDAIVNAGTVSGLSTGNASGNIPVANGTVCTNLNADKLDGNDASAFAAYGHTHSAVTTSTNGFMSNTDKTKLDGIASGAQVNQNAFANILVGATTVVADAPSDTVEFVAGTNIALAGDATNDKVTIGVTGTVASSAACIGNAATATKLATARTINGVSFDGSGNITVEDSTKLSKTGGTLSGHLLFDASSERQIKTTGTNINHGIFLSSVSCGFFDWQNNRAILQYIPASNTINITPPITATLNGNANTATKLATARTISLTGDVSGSATFDGSANATITATVADDSHNHTLATINGAGGGKQLFTLNGTTTACNATGSAGATSLSLTGVTPTNGTFLAGQIININGAQYMIQANVTAASGSATVTVSPALVSAASAIAVDMNTTFTVPTGVTKVLVSMAGGGGGGGGNGQSSSFGGGGGGGGAAKIAFPVFGPTSGQQITITVGAGGAGSSYGSSASGATGGTSSFGSYVSCPGGAGGRGGSYGTGGAAGGTGGSPGKNGESSEIGNSGGQGGDSIFGSGGIGTTSNGTGIGILYGGGGGGSTRTTSNTPGSAGAPGFVLVEW